MSRLPVQVATIILAGGQGTRLQPLTLNHSKPAVSFGGRYRLIDIPISNSINSDFRQIFVIAQYLSSELEHHISQTYHFDQFTTGSVDVLTPQENEKGEKEWFEGTADAVRKNLPILLKSPADYFLILSGDQLYNLNFQNMIEFAKASDADLTIATLAVPAKEAARMGLLQMDEQGKVLNFCEKPKEEKARKPFEVSALSIKRWDIQCPPNPCFLGSMGIYVFKREALIKLLEEDNRPDFGFHLIDTAVKQGKTYAYLHRGYWEDIGTIASYFEANLTLTQAQGGLETHDEKNPIYTRPTYLPGPRIEKTLISQSIICEGSIIEAAEITHSVIGLRCHIKQGTIIRDSVLMGNYLYLTPFDEKKNTFDDFSIGENCLIEKTIIDEQVRIGNNVQLINQKKLQSYDGNGIFIRDGIIIVTAGTNLPDHFIL